MLAQDRHLSLRTHTFHTHLHPAGMPSSEEEGSVIPVNTRSRRVKEGWLTVSHVDRELALEAGEVSLSFHCFSIIQLP